MTFGNLFNLSGPVFLPLQNKKDKVTYSRPEREEYKDCVLQSASSVWHSVSAVFVQSGRIQKTFSNIPWNLFIDLFRDCFLLLNRQLKFLGGDLRFSFKIYLF